MHHAIISMCSPLIAWIASLQVIQLCRPHINHEGFHISYPRYFVQPEKSSLASQSGLFWDGWTRELRFIIQDHPLGLIPPPDSACNSSPDSPSYRNSSPLSFYFRGDIFGWHLIPPLQSICWQVYHSNLIVPAPFPYNSWPCQHQWLLIAQLFLPYSRMPLGRQKWSWWTWREWPRWFDSHWLWCSFISTG